MARLHKAPDRIALNEISDDRRDGSESTARTDSAYAVVRELVTTAYADQRTASRRGTGLVPLKVLHFLLVFLGLFETWKGTQVPPFPSRLVDLARI
jgi:hypothetical protein